MNDMKVSGSSNILNNSLNHFHTTVKTFCHTQKKLNPTVIHLIKLQCPNKPSSVEDP